MDHFKSLRTIVADRETIVTEWMAQLAAERHELHELLGSEYIRQQSETFLIEFPRLTVPGTASLDRERDSYEGVSRWLQNMSLRTAQHGGNPHTFMPYLLRLKAIISVRLKDHPETTMQDLYDGLTALDRVFDRINHLYYDFYLNRREQVIKAQALAIQELSAPVIQVWNGILALPLIGAIDTQRAKGIMENLLREVVRTKSPHVIIDITGVPIVDTGVAERLIKTVEAARLVGAECVMTGIRPEVAQTLVMLGVNLGDIVTKATLQSGLAYILQGISDNKILEESVS